MSNLRLSLLSIAYTCGTAFVEFALINRGWFLSAWLVLFIYWLVLLAFAFARSSLHSLPPFRFVGSHDNKRAQREGCK